MEPSVEPIIRARIPRRDGNQRDYVCHCDHVCSLKLQTTAQRPGFTRQLALAEPYSQRVINVCSQQILS